MLAPPSRAALCDLVDRVLPPEIASHVTHIGRILGAGSLYIAVEVDWKEEGRTYKRVLSLLRPYAQARGRTGFRYLEWAFEDPPPEDRIAPVVLEQLSTGRRFLDVESNSLLAPEMGRRAAQVYGPLHVRVDGIDFSFEPLHVTHAGSGWFLSDKLEGSNIIDLPENTKAERADKERATLGSLTADFYTIVSGSYCDNDRHGGNCKVWGNTLRPLDLWGLLYDPPTSEQLSAFVRAFGRALATSRSFDGFQSNLSTELRGAAQQFPETPWFFYHAQDALLALAESSHTVSSADILAAFNAALEMARPEIRDAFGESMRATRRGQLLLSGMRAAQKRRGLVITYSG